MMLAGAAFAQDEGRVNAETDSVFFDRPCGGLMFAQGPMGQDVPMPPGGPMSPGAFENQRKHIEQLRLLKMLELLDLTDQQEIPFLTALNEARQQREEFEKSNRERIEALAEGLESKTLTDAQIYKLVDDITNGLKLQLQNVDGFLAKSRGILTAEQYGKLVIFQMRFEVEMLEQLGRFREFRRQGQSQDKGRGLGQDSGK